MHHQVVEKCKTVLDAHYGQRLREVILYGSLARNQAVAMSDIDLLVLLNGPFDYFAELRTIRTLLYPIQLESDALSLSETR